jgi:acetoin:2,6-dichlorophenolindophenol oxidoreductase subunit alpha
VIEQPLDPAMLSNKHIRALPRGIDSIKLHSMYAAMVKIRLFEDKVAQLIVNNEINGPCHLYTGQEAIAAGVCAVIRKTDWVYSTHRGHGHYIAKGGNINTLMAELLGRSTGCSKGKGGSMHIASPENGLPGSSAIVAGTIPIAVGTALSFSLQNKKAISVAFFGDGAAGEGVFYESMNFAALKKCPVVFICENNLYSTHMPIEACLSNTSIIAKAQTFNIPGVRVDGNKVLDVYLATQDAADRARNGNGPTLIECMTYRWYGHVGANTDLDKGLRSNKELNTWKKKCPIKQFKQFLIKVHGFTLSELQRVHNSINKEIEEAVLFAKTSPYPDKNDLPKHVFK